MSIADKITRLSTARTSIQNAIKSKGVSVADGDGFEDFASKIQSITQLDTSDANAADTDILLNKTAYVNGRKVTGKIASKSAQTYNPSTTAQTISSGQYLSGTQTIAATTASNVPSALKETKTATPTKSQQTINATSGKLMTSVTVNAIPSEYIIPSGSQTLTSNNTYDVTSLAEVVVNVAGGGTALPSGISKFDFGTITVSSAFTTTRQTFNHKLGVTPDFMMVWTPANIATTYSMLVAIRGNQFGWRSSAYNNHYAYHGNSTTTVTWTNSNSTSYGISNMTATTFQLASSSSSYYWRAGTYNYIAIKFS